MDPLSQLVGLVRPSRLNWKIGEVQGAWTQAHPASPGAAFCLVVEGECRAQASTEARPRGLAAGDFLLLIRPPPWTLSGESRVTRLVGGHFHLDPVNADLLTSLLPSAVQVRAWDGGGGRLGALVRLIGEEASADRPGQSLVLERLIEVMVMEALRQEADPAGPGRRGLTAGLDDARIAAALRAMHGDVRRGWTVEALAGIAGLSRSAFAERFTRLAGLPPLAYLLQWRMALAKDALRTGRASLAEIAEASGYASTGAFSTAFARVVGHPPATFRRERPASDG